MPRAPSSRASPCVNWRVGNRSWLVRRIAWRLQALAEGDLSDRARHYADQIVNDADLRLLPPKAADPTQPAVAKAPPKPVRTQQPDSRLPQPGSIITRLYKGQTLQVEVLPAGPGTSLDRHRGR